MTCTVAYQGGPGAFAEEACRLFLPDCLAVARPSFADVAEAVRAGEAELGMLPRENNIVGSVPGVAELIERNGLTVRGIHALPVRLHLMARPGVTLEEVRTVVSHPMALAQCAMTLRRPRPRYRGGGQHRPGGAVGRRRRRSHPRRHRLRERGRRLMV